MKTIIGYISAFAILLVGLIIAFGSWGTISAGHRGVVLRNGAVQKEIKGEGFYLKTPWIESVEEVDVRIQKEDTVTEAASKDLQMVKIHLALNYRPDPMQVGIIYQEIGVNYRSVVIDPAVAEGAKAVISQFTAEELVTKRELVKDRIAELLAAKLLRKGINTDAVNIVDFGFSKSFNAAIEAKVTAEQDALAAKNKLAQVEFEASQKIAESRGKAQAMDIEAKAMVNNPQILQLRALEKWDGKMPQFMGSNTMPFVNVGQIAGR